MAEPAEQEFLRSIFLMEAWDTVAALEGAAATLARGLQAAFGHLADAKLGEVFTVTGRVATWAHERPDEFCRWLADAPLPPASRERVLDALSHCHMEIG